MRKSTSASGSFWRSQPRDRIERQVVVDELPEVGVAGRDGRGSGRRRRRRAACRPRSAGRFSVASLLELGQRRSVVRRREHRQVAEHAAEAALTEGGARQDVETADGRAVMARVHRRRRWVRDDLAGAVGRVRGARLDGQGGHPLSLNGLHRSRRPSCLNATHGARNRAPRHNELDERWRGDHRRRASRPSRPSWRTWRATARREMAERIMAARELGDLKENAEYHIAKEDQAHLETKIKRLVERLRNAVVVDAPTDSDVVAFGTHRDRGRRADRARGDVDARGRDRGRPRRRASSRPSRRWPGRCMGRRPGRRDRGQDAGRRAPPARRAARRLSRSAARRRSGSPPSGALAPRRHRVERADDPVAVEPVDGRCRPRRSASYSGPE